MMDFLEFGFGSGGAGARLWLERHAARDGIA
jgi:hypothetical protein